MFNATENSDRSLSSSTDDLDAHKTHLTTLIDRDQISQAYEYTINIAMHLKFEEKFIENLQFHFFFLKKLIKKSHYHRISIFFDKFLSEFLQAAAKNLEQSTFKEKTFLLLLNETIELCEELAQKDFSKSLEVYNSLIVAFSKNNSSHLSNLILIKIGDEYAKRMKFSDAQKWYEKVFITLSRIIGHKHEVTNTTLLGQLLTALEKIKILNNASHHELYNVFLSLLKKDENNTRSILTLFEDIFKTKDYNFYVKCFCISVVMLHIANTSKELLPQILIKALSLGSTSTNPVFKQVLKLENEISITDAVENNDINKLRDLLNCEIGISASKKDGYSPLQLAVQKGFIEIAKVLIRSGARVDEVTSSNNAPPPALYLAIDKSEENDVEIIQILIDHGAWIDKSPNLNLPSPLYYAIIHNKKAAAVLLFNSGATITQEEKKSLKQEENALYKELMKGNRIFHYLLYGNDKRDESKTVTLLSGDKNSSKTPIFCPYSLFGDVTGYALFARGVSLVEKEINKSSSVIKNDNDCRPVYGIKSPVYIGGKNIPQNMEEAASLCIDAIKGVQPVGPYILFGWSFGGLLSYEIARQLKSRGEKAIVVGLYDTLAPNVMSGMQNEQYAHHITGILNICSKLPESRIPSINNQTELGLIEKSKQIDLCIPSNSIIKFDGVEITEVVRTNLKSALNYRPPQDSESPFITSYAATTTLREYGKEDLGWAQETNNHFIAFKSKKCHQTDHFSLSKNKELVTELAEYICKHSDVIQTDQERELCSSYAFRIRLEATSRRMQKQQEKTSKVFAQLSAMQGTSPQIAKTKPDTLFFGTKERVMTLPLGDNNNELYNNSPI